MIEKQALAARKIEIEGLLAEYTSKNLKLGMTRGVPCGEQLDLSDGLLHALDSADCRIGAADYRNYGILDGIPEAKEYFAPVPGVSPKEIMVLGNASLNIMYDSIVRAMLYGVVGSEKPWSKYEKIKFLCPVPGYDRHFSICQSLGIEMINVPMTSSGPDMDIVEELAAGDDSIKGIWCTPKYSNPQGYTYSDDTVRRFAGMKTAASDFRILWDNAYAVHHLGDEQDELLNIMDECRAAGNENRVFIYASTSKITFPGAGISFFAASQENLAQIRGIMGMQTIGHDKINQLRHVNFMAAGGGVEEHMKKHAEILRPKFGIVDRILTERLGNLGIAKWTKPRGGYFVSLNVPEGCAKRTIELAAGAGVALTPAGSTYPYMSDPRDENIRIAPTFPSCADLEAAMEILCLCVELAWLEK